jgi:CTP:molybdopterin cytidylyltransferase MocA
VSVAGVVLAAGRGSRFSGDTHKLLAPLGPGGRRVVDHVLDAVTAAGLGRAYLVVGAVDVEGVPPGVVVVRNPRWADGLATSLRAGIDAAAADGFGAVVVGLADQPGVPAEAWRRVGASPAPVAVAVYDDGGRGHPVRLAAAVWDGLPEAGEAGARGLLTGDVAAVPCPGSLADIDTLEDLRAWS